MYVVIQFKFVKKFQKWLCINNMILQLHTFYGMSSAETLEKNTKTVAMWRSLVFTLVQFCLKCYYFSIKNNDIVYARLLGGSEHVPPRKV